MKTGIPTLWAEFSFVPYLKEVDVVLSLRKFLQLSVSPPELHHLPLYLLQQLLSLTDSCPLLDSDQLLHLAALFLYGADQPGENPLTLLHCSLRGVLWSTKFFRLWSQSRQCVNNVFKAPMETDAHLDVSDHISEFLLRVLQFLHRLQRGFLEFILREYKRWISYRAVPEAAQSNISSTLDFQDGKFWFYSQRIGLHWKVFAPSIYTSDSNIRAQDTAAGPGHILHSLYSIFEMQRPLHQAIRGTSFILRHQIYKAGLFINSWELQTHSSEVIKLVKR